MAALGLDRLNSWSNLPKGPLWLESPHLPAWQKKILAKLKVAAPKDPGLVWVMSSGTQSVGQIKCIGLTREGILASAVEVNRHLQSTAKDRWLIALPLYHVGGFTILARAHLSGAGIYKFPKWKVDAFVRALYEEGITLCSLVPTQIHDLVAAKSSPPKSLRAIVVGGGALDPELYKSARALGWPLLPSYGLTECASQVATASLASLKQEVSREDAKSPRVSKFKALPVSELEAPPFLILKHAEIELREQRIFLRAKSLARFVMTGRDNGCVTLEDPAPTGWFATEDLAEWQDGGLKLLGRRDEVVKVLGVLVGVPQVEWDLRTFFLRKGLKGDLTVLPLKHEREGHSLVLITDTEDSLREWETQLDAYNAQASGPMRVRQLCWTHSIPRSDLGKVRRAELLREIGLK